MPPADKEFDIADMAAMEANAQFDTPAEGAKPADGKAPAAPKPSIVYEDFKMEKPDLDLLSDDEREALKDDAHDPDTFDDEDLVDDEADDDADDDEALITAPVKAAAKPAPAAAAAAAAAEPAAEPIPDMPPPPIDIKIDYQELVTKADADIAALKKQFNDGEVGDDAYTTKLEELGDVRGEAKANLKIATAYIAKASEVFAAQEVVNAKSWGDAIKAFKESHPHLFGDDHFDKFNAHVMQVTKREGPWAKLPFAKQLAKAAMDYAFEADKPELATGKKPAKAAAATPDRAHRTIQKPTRQPVPTLARLPASKTEAADGGRFAGMDEIMNGKDPMRAEAALARMSPADQDAYLASA